MRKHRILRKDLLKICFIFGFAAAFTFFALKTPKETEAASLDRFDPGNIISDYTMSNVNTMSVADIDRFLHEKGTCDNTNTYLASNYPNLSYHIENGHFVCLADERFGEGTNIGSGQTAAEVIYEVAHEYSINPQVLIVLLQKEQGLITDSWPNNIQYRSATGYGCPDTAACDSKYYGFKNQLKNAADLFRTVLDGGWTNYPLGVNYIYYNPDRSCGGSNVEIKNLATSSLYRYTPYQPNAGALAAGYGTATCGAYGNRNFYLYFMDWFGDPTITKTYSTIRIPDGTYYINSASNSDSIDAKNNNVNTQPRSANSETQKWAFTYNANTNDYTITDSSGKAIDVESASKDDGANVQLWESNKTCAQRWKIITINGEKVSLLSTCSDKALTVDTNKNIVINRYTEKSSQSWRLAPVDPVIEEGVYYIRSAVDKEKVVDINAGVRNATTGSNIQVWNNNNTGAQRWKIKKTNDGYYVISNPQSGKIFDVSAASAENGANIQLWNSNNSCAQKWKIIKNNNESYTFISACSNKVLDLAGGVAVSGRNLQTYSANNTKAQQWTLDQIKIVENAEYNITSSLSEEKVVDIAANKNANGTNIQIWDTNNTSAQRWKITYNPETDFYSITNPQTNKSIDVLYAGVVNDTNIQLWESNSTCAQKWIIYQDQKKESYIIASACSDLVIDVANGNKNNGTNIHLWKYNDTAAQKWIIKK